MSVAILAMLAAVAPLRLIPDKIVYPEGGEGTISVVLTNRSGEASAADLVVKDAWGLEGEEREIYSGKVELKGNEGKTVAVKWPGSRVRYGHEVRAATLSGGKEIGSRSEYFSVNDDWWRVCQGVELEPGRRPSKLLRHFQEYYGYPVKPGIGFAGRLVRDGWRASGWDCGPFASYHTLCTRWQMQKASVGGNRAAAEMPDGVKWHTANGSEPRDSGKIRLDSEESHKWGFRHTRFTINLMEGPYGFALARKYPERVLRNGRGQYAGLYNHPMTDPLEMSKADTSKHLPWTFVEPNFFREDVLKWALDDLEAAVRGFGEDGVYFDGRYMKRQGYDAFGNDLRKTAGGDEAAVRNMRATLKKLLDGHPQRFIWSNGPNPDFAETALLDHPRSGLLNELQWNFMVNPSMSCSSYRGFLESLIGSRDMCYLPGKWVKQPGKVHIAGYLTPQAAYARTDPVKSREVWTMSQHAMAMVAATLAHPFAGGLQTRNFKQMMTRYSEFFWHEKIEVMKRGWKHFACDSLREVWYDDMIYVRECDGYTDWYVHLVNVPETEACVESAAEDPPEVDDAEVSTKLFGPEGVKAWAIRPYGYLDGRMEPKREEVAVKTVNGETVFAVPPFKYYTLLAIRKYKR